MIYELTPHQLQRLREESEAFVARMAEWKADICRAQARQAGKSEGFVFGLGDPDDVNVVWAGQHVLTIPREALAGDDPLVDFGELPPVPDDPGALFDPPAA